MKLPPVIAAAIAVVAVTVSGCASTWSPQTFVPVAAAARAYAAAHPVSPVRGMIAGVVTAQLGDVAWACPHGPGSLEGNCGAWEGALMTADGRTYTFTCGRISDRAPALETCTFAGYVPEPGDYVYVPASLRVTRQNGVRVIALAALDVWDQGVPAQCNVADWTAIAACEHPAQMPASPPASVPATFAPSGSG